MSSAPSGPGHAGGLRPACPRPSPRPRRRRSLSVAPLTCADRSQASQATSELTSVPTRGQSPFERIPCGAPSAANSSATAITPALMTEYAAVSWSARMPVSEAMWIIEPRPCVRIAPKHARATLNADVRFTSRSSRKRASEVASIEPANTTSAFVTRTSSRPLRSSSARCTARSELARSRWSQARNAAPVSRAIDSPRSRPCPVKATAMPSSHKRCTHALPSSDVPPVTSALRPSRPSPMLKVAPPRARPSSPAPRRACLRRRAGSCRCRTLRRPRRRR